MFNEGSGTTTADSSGNGHTGTLGSGVTWTGPQVGAHAIALNGTSAGAVTVPGPVVNTSLSYTVSAWVNLNSIGGANQTFVSINGLSSPTSTTVSGFYLQFIGGLDQFALAMIPGDTTANGATNALSTTRATAGTWYHLVGVDNVSAGTLSLYVNGGLQATVAYTGSWQATGNTMIGQGMYSGNQVDFVSGKIDDVSLYSSALTAAQIATLNQPTIATGYTTSCMLNSGNAYCWGDNSTGALGNNSTVNSSVPVPVYTGGVLSGVTLTQVAVGSNFACALSSAGAEYCWGQGSSGQLGNGSSTESNVPVLVSGGLTFTQIDTGATFACGLTSAGAAYCWGAGNQGQLGNGTTTAAQTTPVAVTTSGTPLSGVTLTQISLGTSFACALSSAGAAYCWGKNQAGQLGNGSITTPQTTATAVTTAGTPLSGVTLTQISASLGGSHTCAVSTAGAGYCWGLGSSGELGNGTTTAAQTTAVAVTTSGVLSGVTLTQIHGGQDQTCALSSAGTAYCWGGNTDGDLGINSTTQSLTPVAVNTSGVLSGKTVTQLGTSANFLSCAIDSQGATYCWGLNNLGQAGNSATAVNSLVPAIVAPSQATTTASGYNHSCMIRSGKAYCWGDNAFGELGNGSTASSNVPVAAWTGGVLSGVTLTQITTANSFTCALASTGAAYCWGAGSSGQLGNGGTAASSVPVAVTTSGALSGKTLTQITAGTNFVCALASTGAAYCWGQNTNGQLGNGTTAASSAPGAVTTSGTPLAGVTLTQITAGSGFTCALGSTGAAYCWGQNTNGQLGNGTITTPQTTATAVTTSGTPLSGVTLTQISAGTVYTGSLAAACALASTGTAYCWGAGGSGQLGNTTTTTTQDTAVAVTATGALAGVTLTGITVGTSFACALGSAGAVYCWGLGTSGQLGDNTTTTSNAPVPVSIAGVLSGVNLTQISSGQLATCAEGSTGAFYCWGGNGSGQAGNPAMAHNFSVPVAVTSEATMVSAGNTHACLLRNGKAYCWGDNTVGELGNSTTTTTPQSTPVAVSQGAMPTGTTLTQISAGTAWTCALASTGSAYCWGNNNSGGITALGNGLISASDVPVAVTMSGLIFTQISVGASFACALTSAGAAYCWGNNMQGMLGNGGTAFATTPTAVSQGAMPTGTTLTQIEAGQNFTCAQASTGAAYCWGSDSNGQLGNGTTTTAQTTPVAVSQGAMPTGTTLTGLGAGTADTCAVGSSGTAYCWGLNTNGQLGNNSTTQSTTAVAVTATSTAIPLNQNTDGTSFACALDVTGTAYCWGLNTSGQLGNNSTTQSLVPTAVTTSGVLSGATLAQVSAGSNFTCTEDTTGAFYCWGGNANGQLGNGTTTTPQTTATVVQGITPGAPTGVTATPGDTTATISWTAPTSLGTGTLTGYTATATAASGTFSCSTTSVTTCVITGLSDGTTYTVTVVTHTTDGDSPASSAATVTPVGALTLTSPSSLTWAVTANGSNQSVVDSNSGDQQFTAADLTGSGAGWHITVSATTFTSGTHTLPNAGAADFTGSTTSLASTAPSATCVGSCTLPTDTTTYPVAITTATSSPSTYTVYDTSAGTGEGTMTIGGSSAANPIGWWVQVPASASSGSYTSTVTLEMVSAP
jgi:alpha-tubulin suppressor-like RCC1 family protein